MAEQAESTPVRLADYVDLLTGFPFKSASYTMDGSGTPLVRGDNVVQGQLRWDNAARWPLAEQDGIERYELEPGDVVLAMDRPWIEAGLKYARIGQHDVPSLLVQRVARLRAHSDLHQGFLFYLIGSRSFTDHVLAVQTGTAVPHISSKQILEFQFLLPPHSEQLAIASVLGSLDDKIELNRRMNRTLEQMAAAIFKAWFVDFEPVRAKASGAASFPGMPQPVFDALPATFADSELGPIPEGWEVKPIGDAVEIKGGGTPSTKSPDFWDGPHHWVTPKDLSSLSDPILLDTSRRLTDAGLAKVSSGLLPRGTVLLSSRAPIGYLAITAIDTAINQGFIAMLPGGNLPPSYLLNWASYYMDDIKGNANGTTFQEISKKNFRPLRAIVPSPEVADGFQSIVGPLYDQVRLNMQESTTLAEARDALLPKLLSGEVRVGIEAEVT